MPIWRKILAGILIVVTIVSAIAIEPGRLIWVVPLILGFAGFIYAAWPILKEKLF